MMQYKNINSNPVTPPPAPPGANNVWEYYEAIREYPFASIDIKEHPPRKNESVSTYRQRLVRMCQGKAVCKY